MIFFQRLISRHKNLESEGSTQFRSNIYAPKFNNNNTIFIRRRYVVFMGLITWLIVGEFKKELAKFEHYKAIQS